MGSRLLEGLRSMPPAPPSISIRLIPTAALHSVPSEILSDSSMSVRFCMEQLRGMLFAAKWAVSFILTISKEPRLAHRHCAFYTN
jgi:hypothetical protein